VSASPSSRTVVIGVGNPDRGDDGCGLEVARRLQEAYGERLRVAESSGDPARLLDLWSGAETAVVIDAIRSGRSVGAILRLEGEAIDNAVLLAPSRSSHGFSVGHAVRLGTTLGRMPGRLVLFGIEVGSTDLGRRISPGVESAIGEVVRRVALELALEGPPTAPPAGVPHA
jgi:hydrogenase maturation protease